MVVGVGGMGTNTVRAVKRRFRNVWNADAYANAGQAGGAQSASGISAGLSGDKLPGMLQLLALDTEPLVNRLDQEPLFADEFAYMGKFDATRLIDNIDQHPEIGSWWNYPSIPLGYIHNGAKQLRPIGRLSFFRNYVTFKQMLETKVTNLDKIRDMEVAQNRGFPVIGNYQLIYVVSSLCGGTGAGMFMDTAHRIRAHVRNNARVVGIFYLPDVLEGQISSDIQRRRIRANAYAAMKELNYFQETQRFKELYPSEQRELPDTPYAPFDFIFLVGRTNRHGTSLNSKTDAENMAAHLIQLTTMSHLSNEILGLEVNVVRERMFDMNAAAGEVTGEQLWQAATQAYDSPDGEAGKQGHFLVYSGFATSALVAPHEMLTDFWQRAFVADLVRRIASGASMSDPRADLPDNDRQQIMNVWQGLQAQMVSRYSALDNDKLEQIQAELEELTGTWHSFWEPVQQSMRQVMMETGIRGALALCDLLSPPMTPGPPESLPRQRLFLINGAPVTEEDRVHWRKALSQQANFVDQVQQIGSGIGGLLLMAFNPRQGRERVRSQAARRARSRLYQQRDNVERMLVEQLGKQSALLREVLRNQMNACGTALARSNQEAKRLADRIDPRISDGYPSTSMYYELETGAVGRDYLQYFYSKAAESVTTGDWQTSLTPVFGHVAQRMSALAGDQLYAQLFNSVAQNKALRQRVHNHVDINHIISIQYGQEVERVRQRPDNRIQQWLGRLNPYIRWDADRFSFHESNLEHIRLAAVPTSRQEDRGLQAATVGQEDFRWIPTGDATRMDALWIVHGLPVTLLERLEEYRAQYDNRFDFPNKEEFHLNPNWAKLPEVTLSDGGRIVNRPINRPTERVTREFAPTPMPEFAQELLPSDSGNSFLNEDEQPRVLPREEPAPLPIQESAPPSSLPSGLPNVLPSIIPRLEDLPEIPKGDY